MEEDFSLLTFLYIPSFIYAYLPIALLLIKLPIILYNTPILFFHQLMRKFSISKYIIDLGAKNV